MKRNMFRRVAVGLIVAALKEGQPLEGNPYNVVEKFWSPVESQHLKLIVVLGETYLTEGSIVTAYIE